MSIEVLDGEFPARFWAEAHGDRLIEAGLHHGLIEWSWRHLHWGSVLELEFLSEDAWERFRGDPAVAAALDAVPDRVGGLLIYRGRGGTASPRQPRRPRPLSGAGAAALEFPSEWTFQPLAEPPRTLEARPLALRGEARSAGQLGQQGVDLGDRRLAGVVAADVGQPVLAVLEQR